MISDILREARRHEELAEQQIPALGRPSFHLSSRAGWMNDPNGFSFYRGEYHLFYQYYPYEAKWNSMHWGHAVSHDLLHWRYLPAALAPDTLADKDGCYSGSAVELPDGRQLLMYTGVVEGPRQPDGTRTEIQTQCLAVGDGVNYEKYDQNPVLTHADTPEGSSPYDFRDPKLWREADGTYRCVVGSRPADGSGQILYYSSPDGFHWRFESVLVENRGKFGLMWECPDFFELDGVHVLLTSPQDMLPSGFEYHNGNGTLALIGDFDSERGTFTPRHDQAVDYGIDFYATQTLLAPDGRRIMIAWMQNWDTLSIASLKAPWFGQMTLPRELSVRDGRLYQWPIRELDALRSGRVVYRDVTFEGALTLEGIRGRQVDVTITLRPGDEEHLYQKFAVWFCQNDAYHVAISFRPGESILKIDRKFSGSRRAIIHQRRCAVPKRNGEITFRMILDRYSVEVFVNQGEQTLSATMYTDLAADGFKFFATGKVTMDIEKYDLDLDPAGGPTEQEVRADGRDL